MTVSLLIAGYEQSFIERAVEGSTWGGYFAAQMHPWFQQCLWCRFIFGWMTAAGQILLLWDLAALGRGEIRRAIRRTHAEASDYQGQETPESLERA
jgi:nitric oxide reductase subunit B